MTESFEKFKDNEEKANGIVKKKKKKKIEKESELVIENEIMSPTELTEELLSSNSGTPQKKPRSKSKIIKTTETVTQENVIEEDNIVKKKKKKKVVKEEAVVEMSPADLAILTDEIVSPKPAKPKRKKKVLKTEDSVEMLLSEVSDNLSSPRRELPKRKKKVTQAETSLTENVEMSPSDELGSPKPEKPKKKKKKKPVIEETEETELKQLDDGVQDETILEDATQPTVETPRKMKRKKKKPKETEQETEVVAEETVGEIEDEGRILAVMIHRTDKLKNNFYIQHPLVRVHIVDMKTGNYLAKQTLDRAVTSYYETRTENLEKILPVMTQPFVFRQEKSTLPVWEELLVFNENFNYFIQENPQVIVFFELIDFVSMNKASRNQRYSSYNISGGWHRIGWAFLKIFGGNHELNVDRKVRLQLFEPPSSFKVKPDQVEIFQWWQSLSRVAYPSTLYVTLKGIVSPNLVEPSTRSMFPTQEELGKMTFEDLSRSINWTTANRTESKRTLTSWNRLHGQTCRIPNNHMLGLKAGRKGCFVLKFSHDGRSLACGCRDNETFPIFIYDIPSGELSGELPGHFGIVYDLCWSKKDDQLLSASNDGTARLWNVKKFHEDKILPHPTFVYTAQFHPRTDSIIVTGAFDQVIRVWDIGGDNEDDYLKQEIEDHHGHINSVCFDEEGEKLYSADSKGVILVWNVYVTEQTSRRAFVTDWTKYQEIKDENLKDVAINFIQLHPSGRKLLVHGRDNIIRMFDLRVQRVIQNYIGSLNFREKLRSTMSPCGTFVFSGSEDNVAYVWNTDSGDQVAKYSELNYVQPVTDVDYHPRDHIIAVCSVGENQPILLYRYNPEVALLDFGSSPRAEDTDASEDVFVNTARTLDTPGRPPSGRTSRQAETLEPLSSSRVLTKDQFVTLETQRYQNVLKKLDTVTLGDPGLFSPHAPPTMSSVMQQQQFNSQTLYMKDSDSTWRPGFSDVGRRGNTSNFYQGRQPQFSLNTSQGKAQFSFQAPLGKQPSKKKVVAICDYKAQRSDELSVFKGDVILLLYKDSANWWMGELANGQQGYFPANYVTTDEDAEEPEKEKEDVVIRKKDRKKKTVQI